MKRPEARDQESIVSQLPVPEIPAAHTFRERVREDFMSGVRSGVNGTPTFFINGRRHDGPYDLEALTEEVERV